MNGTMGLVYVTIYFLVYKTNDVQMLVVCNNHMSSFRFFVVLLIACFSFVVIGGLLFFKLR